jgi:HSP20 family molecular chaperone IbpA
MKPNNDIQLFRELTVGIENILESMFGNERNLHRVNFPKKNIVQTSDETYRIDFSLAGYEKDQIDIYVDEESMLNVKSEKVETGSDENEEYPRYLMREVAQRAFHTRIKLIETEVDGAKMENGILSIFIKKKAPSENKKIEVK